MPPSGSPTALGRVRGHNPSGGLGSRAGAAAFPGPPSLVPPTAVRPRVGVSLCPVPSYPVILSCGAGATRPSGWHAPSAFIRLTTTPGTALAAPLEKEPCRARLVRTFGLEEPRQPAPRRFKARRIPCQGRGFNRPAPSEREGDLRCTSQRRVADNHKQNRLQNAHLTSARRQAPKLNALGAIPKAVSVVPLSVVFCRNLYVCYTTFLHRFGVPLRTRAPRLKPDLTCPAPGPGPERPRLRWSTAGQSPSLD